MKHFILVLSAVFAFGATQAQAFDMNSLNRALVLDTVSSVGEDDYLIDWKIGDQMDYKVRLSGMDLGTLVKRVDSYEGDGVWLRQEMKMMGQDQLVEALIDRNTGELLKLRQNGEDQPLPDGEIEIIEQKYETVTVTAGTFECFYIHARTKDIPKLESWMNPQDTVIDGVLKQAMEQQGMPVELELTSFKHGS